MLCWTIRLVNAKPWSIWKSLRISCLFSGWLSFSWLTLCITFYLKVKGWFRSSQVLAIWESSWWGLIVFKRFLGFVNVAMVVAAHINKSAFFLISEKLQQKRFSIDLWLDLEKQLVIAIAMLALLLLPMIIKI